MLKGEYEILIKKGQILNISQNAAVKEMVVLAVVGNEAFLCPIKRRASNGELILYRQEVMSIYSCGPKLEKAMTTINAFNDKPTVEFSGVTLSDEDIDLKITEEE